MRIARWLHFGQDTTNNRDASLYEHADLWGNALAGLTTLTGEAYRESVTPFAGTLDPFGHGATAGQRAWDTQSRAPNEVIMPVDIRYFYRPDQLAPSRITPIGPFDQTEQRANALQQALVADMLMSRPQ